MKKKLMAIFLTVLMLLSVVSTVGMADNYDPSVDDIFDGTTVTTTTTTQPTTTEPTTTTITTTTTTQPTTTTEAENDPSQADKFTTTTTTTTVPTTTTTTTVKPVVPPTVSTSVTTGADETSTTKTDDPTDPSDPSDPSNPDESTSATEPSSSETEPSETEPSETEPSETEPSETEPSETEPTKPVELKAPVIKAVQTAKTKITITWGEVQGAEKYIVFRAMNGSKSFLAVKETTGLKFVNKIRGGNKYQYKVRAVRGEEYVDSTVKTVKCMKFAARPKIKVTKAKKSFKVKVTAKVKYAKGYQIRYSTNKNFKKARTVLSGAKKTVKKLKANKTYFVKVRAYKIINGSKKYGKYSKVAKVKTK